MSKHTTDGTVVLEIFTDAATASIAQAKLKEAGIGSFLQEENVMGLNPTGGVELKIFSKELERAREILAT